MESRKCSFCGGNIEVGTGKMYVKKDGSTLYFCTSKCQKNMKLGRIPRRVEWTDIAHKLKLK
ncbi:MAG: 50S ribosomal protein L24e [ANME-2 cluster archaeon]|nr:50S ribosomal protein L24e [ANME-2 cluster archaeon]